VCIQVFKKKVFVSYCAESALCCTIIPDRDSLYLIRSIQYNIFACNIIVRENDVVSCQKFAGHAWDHWVTPPVVYLKLSSGKRHDEQHIMNRKACGRKPRWHTLGIVADFVWRSRWMASRELIRCFLWAAEFQTLVTWSIACCADINRHAPWSCHALPSVNWCSQLSVAFSNCNCS
jgi:hypothetical protein